MAYTIYYRKTGSTPWKRSKTVSSTRKVAEKTGFSHQQVKENYVESLQVNPFSKVLIDNAGVHQYQIVKR